MNKTYIDIINLLALIISVIGSYLMYHFSPKVDSHTYLHSNEDLESIQKTDAYKNKIVRFGMLLLVVGFILQAFAIAINITIR